MHRHSICLLPGGHSERSCQQLRPEPQLLLTTSLYVLPGQGVEKEEGGLPIRTGVKSPVMLQSLVKAATSGRHISGQYQGLYPGCAMVLRDPQAGSELQRPSVLTALGKVLSPCDVDKWRNNMQMITFSFLRVHWLAIATGTQHNKAS